jgi:anti-sigma factor RsiW
VSTPAEPVDMSCREVVELVTDYLEGAMPAADRGRLEAHLAACEDCARWIAQLARTADAVGALRERDVPPEALAALVIAFRAVRR